MPCVIPSLTLPPPYWTTSALQGDRKSRGAIPYAMRHSPFPPPSPSHLTEPLHYYRETEKAELLTLMPYVSPPYWTTSALQGDRESRGAIPYAMRYPPPPHPPLLNHFSITGRQKAEVLSLMPYVSPPYWTTSALQGGRKSRDAIPYAMCHSPLLNHFSITGRQRKQRCYPLCHVSPPYWTTSALQGDRESRDAIPYAMCHPLTEPLQHYRETEKAEMLSLMPCVTPLLNHFSITGRQRDGCYLFCHVSLYFTEPLQHYRETEKVEVLSLLPCIWTTSTLLPPNPPPPPPTTPYWTTSALQGDRESRGAIPYAMNVSQGRIYSDKFTCCHTEIEAVDPTFHLTQSQYTDTGPTSPSADPITPGAWQGSHWSANI